VRDSHGALANHLQRNPVLAARLPAFPQVLKNSRGTINSVTGSEGFADKSEQSRIFLNSVRYWMIQPCVVAGARNAEKRHGC